MESFSSLMEITSRPNLVFISGHGSWLKERGGEEYLDFIQGWAVNCLGHSPRVLVEAVAEQVGRLINASPAFYNEPMIRLADMLTANSCFDRIFFGNSGAEANEGAIKLARKWGARHRDGAYEIITMEHGFHGRTLATMSASGKAQWEKLFEPKVPGFPKVPLNDLAAVKEAINERTVAVMLEPVQGEAGVYPATPTFLQGLRDITREHNLLLIFDEVQTGMGRTGSLFAYQHSGVEPDIMTLGKGLGGGVPISALLAKEPVCAFEHGDQGGTFNGNPLMTAAAGAVLETLIQPGFLDNVRTQAAYLRKRLESISTRHGLGEIRGCGMLLALDTVTAIAPNVVGAALDRRLILNAPRPSTLRFMPSLTVTKDEIDHMAEILDDTLGELVRK
ncbi:acetylornithine transaminase [Halothiobacillus sp.]|uniref:acetylornithine transaminase n=1 Tax=Halothiobacillus sp. TaxID=1891311 RepID=UPI00262B1A26|nr:acetylornithine transaminase [Halothiobacillus sp.]MDD4965750.1 acetylornithine transaminase [Halothiobacillus sp.]